MKTKIVSSEEVCAPVHGPSTSLLARDHIPECSPTVYNDQRALAYEICAHLCLGEQGQECLVQVQASLNLSNRDANTIRDLMLEIGAKLAIESMNWKKSGSQEG